VDPIEKSVARNVSVRLPQSTLDDVVAIARVDGVTMGEVIRRSIAEYSAARMNDVEWQEQVREAQRQLERLLPPEPAR
jgi:hypothetical protein